MKKVIVAILAVAMCFSFAACGSKFNLEEYKALVSECQTEIESAFVPIGNMANYEINYMKISQNIGNAVEPSKIVQSAQDWLQKEAGVKPEQIEAADNNINNKYKEILKIEASGTEAEEIQQSFFELYKDYSSMHHNVTTATLTMSDFSNETLDIMNSFSKNDEQLKTLLK